MSSNGDYKGENSSHENSRGTGKGTGVIEVLPGRREGCWKGRDEDREAGSDRGAAGKVEMKTGRQRVKVIR